MTDYAVWVPGDDTLAEMSGPDLWDLLGALQEYKKMRGRGRSQEAAYVRGFCEAESERIKEALRAQGLPTKPPKRPWRAWWAEHQERKDHEFARTAT